MMDDVLSPRVTAATSPRRRETVTTPDRVEAAYRRQSDQMWRALLAYSGDPEVASDAVAEAFAQALRRGSAIRNVDRWVWKASFRIAAGELKERGRLSPEINPAADPPSHDLDLRSALMQVSPRQRAALFLFYYGGYPPLEIAEMIGSTQSAVRVHLFRGRKRLAEILDGGPHD